VIAPDRRKEGTNGLLISPAGLIDYQFGLNSFQKHIEQAQKYHIQVEVCEHSSLELDLDLPEDLDLLSKMEMIQFNMQSVE
jgi:2-phospho-L-lactate guanylyltransferase